MNPPDVTTATAEWTKIRGGNTPLWHNNIFEDVYSTDGGITFTISTTRESPDKEREVFTSRKV